MTHRVDVAIIGSGFAGSILAWILARKGMRVALVDGATHPRFAIGESSTPIADTILRRLGARFDLPALTSLSAWGRWQSSHPELACGRKRGFSYFAHQKGEPFQESRLGERSLLVAASASDDVADTHWYRPDVDTFYWQQAVLAGARDLTGHKVVAMETVENGTFVVHCQGTATEEISCEWIIDASGQAGVLAKHASAPSLVDQLRTRTSSIFAHYAGVDSWNRIASESNVDTSHDPFDPDDAAQHHLLDRGWVWMLRFNNGITSVGYTGKVGQPLASLDQIAADYPALGKLMQEATLLAPLDGPVRSSRLQRWFDPVVDTRRIMLPTAAVTLDPLHSTGIAHALAGVERVSEILACVNRQQQIELIEQYRHSLLEETRLLDRLVSTAYETLNDLERFAAACMLYFAGAIRCEERLQRGETPSHLWNADDAQFLAVVECSCDWILDRENDHYQEIRQQLQPWNSAGLMNPNVGNRYAYTATKR